MTVELVEGQTVRFTAGRLGLMEHPESTRMVEDYVESGDIGWYVGPHPAPVLADENWVLIEVWCEVSGRRYLCPCTPDHFEVVD